MIDVKNLLGLNQAEIVSGLALDLLKVSKQLMNKITKIPFRIKMGFHFLVQLLEELLDIKIINIVYLVIPLIQ
jgi:hypothetical protein